MKTIGTEEHFVTDEVARRGAGSTPVRARTRRPARSPPRWRGGSSRSGAADRGDGRGGSRHPGDLAHLARSSEPPGGRGERSPDRDERPHCRARERPRGPIPGLRHARHPRARRRRARARARGHRARPQRRAALRPHRRAQPRPSRQLADLRGRRVAARPAVHPPQIPQPRVRAALYAGFDDAIDNAFATYGIGWHYETGVQFLRLALAGVFDRFPDLQVLLGHWGEVVLFYLDRADGLAMQAKLPQTFSEYVRRNAYITAGGVYSQRYCGGRSRWSAWSASCLRPTTRTGRAPTVASSASSRPPASIRPTRRGSPRVTGMRS